MDGIATRLDAKLLYRRLDGLFAEVEGPRPRKKVMESFLEDFFRAFREDLRLGGGLLYGPRRDDLELLGEVGDLRGARPPETLDPALPPLRLVFQHGVYIFADPFDADGPARFGLLAPGAAAGVAIGRRPHRYVLLLLLGTGWVREELDFTLNTVRAALGSRMVEERLRGGLTEAAEIQQSLLLEEPPTFGGYEIAARSLPAEEVGGDFFDFLPFDDELLGFAVGDASGHGLPAALLVRDVVTGLRMGIEKDLKVAEVFARLNRVIHRSNLSSRFVSRVLRRAGGGRATWCTSTPGTRRRCCSPATRTVELETGGTVIGPLPEVRFRQGLARLEPGDVLVLCTDGILERRNRAGDFFGQERLEGAVREAWGQPAGGCWSACSRRRASSARRATGRTTPRWSSCGGGPDRRQPVIENGVDNQELRRLHGRNVEGIPPPPRPRPGAHHAGRDPAPAHRRAQAVVALALQPRGGRAAGRWSGSCGSSRCSGSTSR